MKRAFAIASVTLGIVAACGPKPARVSPPPGSGSGTGSSTGTAAAVDAGVVEAKDPLATAVERIVELYEAIATMPATPCPEAARSIDRWTAEHTDALVQVRDAARGEQAALVDGLFHDASPRLAAAMKAIDALAARCASEPAVGAALARLSAGAEDAPR